MVGVLDQVFKHGLPNAPPARRIERVCTTRKAPTVSANRGTGSLREAGRAPHLPCSPPGPATYT